MKRQYGVFQGLILSLFSPAYYRDVARNWGGIGIIYLLLLLFVTWVPILAFWQLSVKRFVNTDFAEALQKMPEMKIQGGKFSSPVEQPYTVADPQTGQILLVFDTTGKINTLQDTKAIMLVTETKIHIRDQHDPNKIQIADLKDLPFGDVDLTREKVQGWAASASNWLGVALFPFVMFGSLIRALIIILIVGVIGLLFKSAVNEHVTYGTLVRMAAMGLTFSTYVDTAATFAGVPIPFFFLLALVSTTFYVVMGARAAYDKSDEYDDDDRDDDRRRRRRRDERDDDLRRDDDLPPPRGDAGSDAFRR